MRRDALAADVRTSASERGGRNPLARRLPHLWAAALLVVGAVVLPRNLGAQETAGPSVTPTATPTAACTEAVHVSLFDGGYSTDPEHGLEPKELIVPKPLADFALECAAKVMEGPVPLGEESYSRINITPMCATPEQFGILDPVRSFAPSTRKTKSVSPARRADWAGRKLFANLLLSRGNDKTAALTYSLIEAGVFGEAPPGPLADCYKLANVLMPR